MIQIQQMCGGRDSDPRFGARRSGEGIFAELQRNRVRLACARRGLNLRGRNEFDMTCFKPAAGIGQLSLFRGRVEFAPANWLENSKTAGFREIQQIAGLRRELICRRFWGHAALGHAACRTITPL